MPMRVMSTVRAELPLERGSQMSRPMAVPMVWNWLDSVTVVHGEGHSVTYKLAELGRPADGEESR